MRLADLIDSIHLPDDGTIRNDLQVAGYQTLRGSDSHFIQQLGIFPAIALRSDAVPTVFFKVDAVADFLATWQIHAEIAGAPMAAIRHAVVATGHGRLACVIERHGLQGFVEPRSTPSPTLILRHFEAFRLRQRHFKIDADGYAHASALIDASIADLDVDRTCDLFFAAEREYWQRRNRAGQVQKLRQDALGIGWANHDHHTYRSGRAQFAPMIAIFEKLGFHCRERFYAGHQSGWGAQVLEQPTAGITIFADVDMSPEELMGDFSHDGLEPRQKLGTVGLWCALHGEAFLEAGMHHLECQFDFESLKQQLETTQNVKVMKPFTAFPYLRQAFTEGEVWPVRGERIDQLVTTGQITPEQADKFRREGALGSHLENLERNDGFKGFNQTGVSEIIAKTDPRLQSH